MQDLVHILVVDQPTDTTTLLVRELRQHGYCVSGVAHDIDHAVALGRDAQVALVSLSPHATFDAIAIARALIERCGVAVLYVVSQLDETLLTAARESRAQGFIFQPFTVQALGGTIEMVRPLRVAEPTASYVRELSPDAQLTPREQEICDALLQGTRPPAIARRFFISIHTVRRHAQAVFRKLGVHSQIELMHRYGAGGPHKKSV